MKFEVISNLSYQEQIFYGYTLNQKKKFMDVNAEFFPTKTEANSDFVHKFCQNSNEKSVLINSKSISCNFTIGSILGNITNDAFLSYYCEYENDQQLNIHFNNDEQQFNETTFFPASASFSFNLIMVGIMFYGESITKNIQEDFFLQTTFLTSFIFTKFTKFKKYMDIL